MSYLAPGVITRGDVAVWAMCAVALCLVAAIVFHDLRNTRGMS